MKKSPAPIDQSRHYFLVERAINYIRANRARTLCLDEVAAHVNLSPFYFQRLFTQWAGVSPKKFAQYLTLEYSKHLLADNNLSIESVSNLAGLSGTSRLHDLFVNIEAMTPGEWKSGGDNIDIQYASVSTPFGYALAAQTERGICHLQFFDDIAVATQELSEEFPNAKFSNTSGQHINEIELFFQGQWPQGKQLHLHLKGTEFQLKVWRALLRIPPGKLVTYGKIAEFIEKPAAHRAAGSAIGKNPIALLIPCHRVIQSNGALGGYRWGENRKAALIGWEACHSFEDGAEA